MESLMHIVDTKSGRLFISGVPSLQEINRLGPFDLIWNLATELADQAPFQMQYSTAIMFGNIELDSAPSDLIKFNKQLVMTGNSLYNGGNVLIHDANKVGRVGMVLACLKMNLDHYDFEEAIAFAYQSCFGPRTSAQYEFVKSFGLQR